jgi:hypothetical protein
MDGSGVSGYGGGVASDCKSDPLVVNGAGSNPVSRTIFTGAKNTKQQGNVGLGLAIAHYVSQMHTVSVPLNDSQDYDLIVDKGGKLLRVQVKTSGYEAGSGYQIVLSMHGGNRKKNYIGRFSHEFEYDVLFVVTANGAMYEIPRERIAGISRRIHVPGPYSEFRVI